MAKSKRLKRYTKCSEKKRQNQLFNYNEKQFYRELNENNTSKNQGIPSEQDVLKYWSSIWSKPKEHNLTANWIESEKQQRDIQPMKFESITESVISEAIRATSNWKAPEVDKIHNFWYKKFVCLHKGLAKYFTHILKNPGDTPDFLTQGTTYMVPKSALTNDPSQYRPITCLPTMYKMLTSCIANKIYKHVEDHNILAEQQKGCRRGHQGCKEQLIIDSIILGQAKEYKRNIHTAFIDYKKAYDSVPHSWLLKVLEIYNIHPNIIDFLKNTMQHWRTNLQLQVGNQAISTDRISIKNGIFQGDSLSPLWFCLALNPLSSMLNYDN